MELAVVLAEGRVRVALSADDVEGGAWWLKRISGMCSLRDCPFTPRPHAPLPPYAPPMPSYTTTVVLAGAAPRT